MQVTNLSTYNLKALKELATELGVTPEGKKTLKATWREAVENYYALQAQAIELSTEAEQAATEASEAIEVAVVSIGSLVVAALTSEAAIATYRAILKGVVLVVVVGFMLTSAAVKWSWNHKHEAAVAYWVRDWMESQQGRSIVTHALIAKWVAGERIQIAMAKWNAIVSEVREYAARSVAWVGLGGCTIEVQ